MPPAPADSQRPLWGTYWTLYPFRFTFPLISSNLIFLFKNTPPSPLVVLKVRGDCQCPSLLFSQGFNAGREQGGCGGTPVGAVPPVLVWLTLLLSVPSHQCNNDYVPVCGSNGDTYQNECYLKQAACKQQSEILLVSEGSCATGRYNSPRLPPRKMAWGWQKTFEFLLWIHYWLIFGGVRSRCHLFLLNTP